MNQSPVCLTCPDGFIIVPDGRCALSCSDAGYNLVVDIFGNEKCVIDCPVGFGPDRFTNNLCRECSIRQENCQSCHFRIEDGVQVCEEC